MILQNKKRILLNITLSAFMLGFSSIATAAPNLTNSLVYIKGTVSNEPCVVQPNEIEVEFGDISNKDIIIGRKINRDFRINLIDCNLSAFQEYSIQFDGIATENNQLLSLSSTSVGSGVGIRIFDDQDRPITFGTPTAKIRPLTQDNFLEFKATLQKRSDITELNQVQLGEFTAISIFTVIYD